jgi:chaperonin GroES
MAVATGGAAMGGLDASERRLRYIFTLIVGTLSMRVPAEIPAAPWPRRARGGITPKHISKRRSYSMKLKPLGDRLIVRAIEEEETTASGLVLPDTAKEKPQKGEVLAVGDGKLDDAGKRIPLDVSEGDEVLYSKYGGTEIKVDGEDLLVLRESDVLAKVA